MRTDKCTKEKTTLSYARMQVEMRLDLDFPEHIDFVNEMGMLVRQQVVYEWKPVKYGNCHIFGHDDSSCKKKENTRWELVPKQPIQPPIQQDTGNDVADQGQPVGNDFITVRRGPRARQEPVDMHEEITASQNKFQALEGQGGTAGVPPHHTSC